MKVVFKKTILGRLMEKKYEAEREGKTIDYFLLTPGEWNELRSDRYAYTALSFPMYSPSEAKVSAMTFECVVLKPRNGHHLDTRRFPVEMTTVLGERIVVAPSEYH